MLYLNHAIRVLSLSGSHNPPYFSRMPSSNGVVSGPPVRAAETLIWLYSCVFLFPVSTAVRPSAFSSLRNHCPFIYSIEIESA